MDTEYHFNSPLLTELGELHRLEQLDLGYCEYWFKPSGPTRRMEAAEILDQGGSIPADTGALTGAIPPQLWRLLRLRYLDLQGQLLTEPLPPELGRQTVLEYLDLSDNLLAGPLPTEWGQLAQPGVGLPGQQRTDGTPAPRVEPDDQPGIFGYPQQPVDWLLSSVVFPKPVP